MNITKEQIREWLETKCNTTNQVDAMFECFNDLAPKWVSVDDELPECGEPVILRINGTVQHVTYMRDRYDEGPDWFEPYHYEDMDAAVDIDGKAKLEWMPLPKTPN